MRHRLIGFLCNTGADGLDGSRPGWTAAAQDAQSVLQAAATAMGATNLKSIQYSGTGWRGAVGQNFRPELDWPRFQMTSYTRTIDFEARSSKEEMVLIQGSNPARGGGRTPIEGERRQVFLVRGNYAWNMRGDNVIPARPRPRYDSSRSGSPRTVSSKRPWRRRIQRQSPETSMARG